MLKFADQKILNIKGNIKEIQEKITLIDEQVIEQKG